MNRRAYLVWLKTASILTVCVGLMAAAASHPSGYAPWLFLFDLLAWPLDGVPSTFDAIARALNAVAGGLMVGWGCLMYLLAKGPLARGDAETARLMLISIVAWFVVDSAGSFAAGIPGNVVLNVSFLVIFGPPLLVLGYRAG